MKLHRPLYILSGIGIFALAYAGYDYFNFNTTITVIISFIGAIWQGQYTDDGYHWGFILSNALSLIDGNEPYKEISVLPETETIFRRSI